MFFPPCRAFTRYLKAPKPTLHTAKYQRLTNLNITLEIDPSSWQSRGLGLFDWVHLLCVTGAGREDGTAHSLRNCMGKTSSFIYQPSIDYYTVYNVASILCLISWTTVTSADNCREKDDACRACELCLFLMRTIYVALCICSLSHIENDRDVGWRQRLSCVWTHTVMLHHACVCCPILRTPIT